MGKIKSSFGKKHLFLFAFKSTVLNAVLIILFSLLITVIFYKLDIDLSCQKWFSIFVCAVCAFFTALLCSLRFKNNGFIIGIISYIPLFIYSTVNLIIGDHDILIFAIKAALCVLSAGIGGTLAVKRAKKVRIR